MTGLFMFGGGLSAVPFLQQMSERTGWFTMAELMNMVAIGEATPGPIGVNMATYAGYMTAGIPGGIVATSAMLLPSVIIALIIARLLVRFRKSKLVEQALYGLRPATLGLISFAGVMVFSLTIFGADLRSLVNIETLQLDYRALILAVILFLATNLIKKAHPIMFLAASAVIGTIIF